MLTGTKVTHTSKTTLHECTFCLDLILKTMASFFVFQKKSCFLASSKLIKETNCSQMIKCLADYLKCEYIFLQRDNDSYLVLINPNNMSEKKPNSDNDI